MYVCNYEYLTNLFSSTYVEYVTSLSFDNTYIHTYIQTYIHTNIHTYKHTFLFNFYNCTTAVQSIVRMFVSRRRARKRIEKLIFLQKTFCRKLCRFRFLRLRKAIVRMQSGIRMRITRRGFTRTLRFIRYCLLAYVRMYVCVYVCMNVFMCICVDVLIVCMYVCMYMYAYYSMLFLN